MTFVNCYRRLSSLRLNNQVLWPKQYNRDVSVGGWGRKLLDLYYDVRLFILNGRMPSDESREFTCLVNGGHNIVEYIVGSPVVW